MAGQPGTMDALTKELGLALASLEGLLTPANAPQLLAELGIDNPPDLTGDDGFSQSLIKAGELAAALVPDIEEAANAGVGTLPEAQAIARLLSDIQQFIVALHEVATELQRATASLPDATALAQFALMFAERLSGAAVISYLETEHPFLRRILSLMTIIEIETASVQVNQVSTTVLRRKLHLERIGRMFTDPLSVLQEVYGWGGSTFDGTLLFANLRDVFDALLPIAVARDSDEDGPADLDFFGMLIRAATGAAPPGIEGSLFVDLPDQFDFTLGQLSDNLRCAVQVQRAFPAGLELILTPPATLEVPGEVGLGGTVALALLGESQDPATAFTVLGENGGTRLQALRISARITGNLIWDAGANKAKTNLGFEAEFAGGELFIQPPASDGFLSSVLPTDGLRAQFEFGLMWTPEHGFTFRDAAGLDATFPLGISVAGLSVPTIYLSLLAANSNLRAELSAAVGVSVGPIQALADRVGMAAVVTFPQDGGNLGIADLQLAFKPPSGIGLTIEAGVVTGGGLISYEPAAGRYSGLLQLQAGQVGITGMGVLDSRLPGGAPGYALLLMLSATFPGVQIGFGFALTGVGGLLALNRRVDVDALRGRLAAGTAGRLLAPQDPVRNAPALLADLDTVFPIASGITVVGPTVQLLWAGLVHLDVGVFIELPGPARVVLLGSAHAEIERDGRAYLSIRVDIVGVVDLRAETAAFDAVLVDSHLMGMLDLTGGAAFRLSWGAQPYAVLSLGGFHPAYHPEPLSFPATLTRIAMVHGTPSDKLYLRFEGYFAITSNTYQYGASVEALITSGHFVVHGTVGFDALIQFVPFHFQFDIRASVTVAYRGQTLAGLTLTGSLTGPGPVVLQAKVCIELLFFDICYSGTFTLGPSTPPPVPAIADLLDTLLVELDNPATLRAAGAPDPYVRLQPPDPSLTATVVAPSGTLVWEQQRAPLDLLLTRVGGTPLPGPAQVSATSAGSSTAQSDWFAPGQFTDLTDDQALTRPGYERLTGGLRLAGAGVADGPGAQATLTIRQIRLPANAIPPNKPVIMFPAWILTSAVGPATPAIAVRTESWIVTTPAGERSDLTGAQARQLATLTTSARAVPAADRLATFTF
jgi:hypothetical protein